MCEGVKAMLNKYIYKSNKEFYNCSLDIIIKKILKCIKIEKDCNSCKNIKNNKQQGGGDNNIIDNVIDNYKKKYEYYNKISIYYYTFILNLERCVFNYKIGVLYLLTFKMPIN